VSQGAVGMTLFFMLSGFILAFTYDLKNISTREYIIRRFSRIYPVYFLAAAITIPFLGFTSLPSWNNGASNQVLLATFAIGANLLLVQAWFPPLFAVWNDGASWSISVESFFYALFPTLRKFFSVSPRRARVSLCASYLVMVTVGASVTILRPSNMSIAYSVPIYRLGEFIVGVALFDVIKRHDKLQLRHISRRFLIFVLPILLVDLAYLGPRLSDYIGHDWIIIPSFAAVLVNLYSDENIVTKLLSSRFLVLLGRSSYSFYAIQAFFILFLLKRRANLIVSYHFLSNNFCLCLITYVLLQITAIGVYLFFEKPIRARIQKRFIEVSIGA